MLFDIVNRQIIFVEQIRDEHRRIVHGLIEIASFIDAQFNADRVSVSPSLADVVSGVKRGLFVRNMVVHLVFIHRIMPRQRMFLRIGVQIVIVRFCRRIRLGIVGLMNGNPADFPLGSRPSLIADRQVMGRHVQVADLRRAVRLGLLGMQVVNILHIHRLKHAVRRKHRKHRRQSEPDQFGLGLFLSALAAACFFPRHPCLPSLSARSGIQLLLYYKFPVFSPLHRPSPHPIRFLSKIQLLRGECHRAVKKMEKILGRCMLLFLGFAVDPLHFLHICHDRALLSDGQRRIAGGEGNHLLEILLGQRVEIAQRTRAIDQLE